LYRMRSFPIPLGLPISLLGGNVTKL
jgi:hypothetical protein